jgi:5-methylcytosine-specific restriction endonuclease McrA
VVVPTERLEARICELAGHLTAATCRFLLLVADFDARKGWAAWEMPSCAAWLSWKCQIAPGTAREQVRVARALAGLPVIRAGFAAARLSYAKVRALTRIATPETERDLAAMATPMTAGQLERFARAHRRVTAAQDADARRQRRLSWGWVDDHVLMLRGLLPADGAAVLLQALRAARSDLEHPHDDHDDGGGDGGGDGGRVSAETRGGKLAARDKEDGLDLAGDKPPAIRKEHAEDLADALVEICAAYLRGKIASAGNPDVYQVIIHAGTAAITAGDDAVTAEDGVPAETSPAFPLRCHFEDGGAISPAALRLIACNATITTMLHDTAGNVLNAGRRTRKPPAALRRAVRERDRCRCRFPGCESRRVDAHHIKYWSNGGETTLANLVSLCQLCRRRHNWHYAEFVVMPCG